jgi:hypothetical protein
MEQSGDGMFGDEELGREATSRQLFLVEFVRGQLEIFAFKRFYQFLRAHISEMVKRDYAAASQFHSAASPMLDSVLLQQFQQRSNTNVGGYIS